MKLHVTSQKTRLLISVASYTSLIKKTLELIKDVDPQTVITIIHIVTTKLKRTVSV
jgi:hypothetical protein